MFLSEEWRRIGAICRRCRATSMPFCSMRRSSRSTSPASDTPRSRSPARSIRRAITPPSSIRTGCSRTDAPSSSAALLPLPTVPRSPRGDRTGASSARWRVLGTRRGCIWEDVARNVAPKVAKSRMPERCSRSFPDRGSSTRRYPPALPARRDPQHRPCRRRRARRRAGPHLHLPRYPVDLIVTIRRRDRPGARSARATDARPRSADSALDVRHCRPTAEPHEPPSSSSAVTCSLDGRNDIVVKLVRGKSSRKSFNATATRAAPARQSAQLARLCAPAFLGLFQARTGSRRRIPADDPHRQPDDGPRMVGLSDAG